MVWQETPPRFAIARFCFNGTRKDEGTLKVGDWVTLQEKHSDGKWYRGFYSFMREDPESSKLFLFPACCLKIAPASFRPTSSTHGPNAEFNSHKLLIDSLPLIKEDRLLETVTKSILEWSTVISEAEKEFAEDTTEREPNPEAEQLKHPLSDLMLLRKTILGTRPDDMRRISLENQSISLIDYGNRLMGLDLILRDRQSSSRLHHRNTGSIRLFQRHQEIELQDKKKEKGDGSRPKEKSSNPRKTLLQARSRRRLAANLHDGKGLTDAIQRLQTLRKNCVCIVLDFKTFIYSLGENEASLYFSLWSAKTRDFLTEEFPVHVSSFGMPHNFSDPNFKSPHCLFVDIPEDEFHDREVFLTVRVIRFGKLLLDPTKQVKGQDNLRRPLGWGMIPVNSFKIRKTAKEKSIPIYGAVQEATFSQGPSAISKNSGTFIQIPDCMVVVSCKAVDLPYHLLHKRQREMERTGKTIPTLENFQEMPLMVRLANLDIPDLLIPGQILARNTLYLTLNEAILSQEKRFNSLELVLWVKNNQGKNIECCFELEPGKPKTSSHSIVFHHNHNPKWAETIKIVIPPEEMLNSHIYFDMRLWSSKERVYDKRVMAFWKLTRDGILQQNGKYDLSLVKLPKIIKDPAFYLTEEDVADKHKLNISVKISSTHFPQNEVISNLLNWKENVQLQEALNKFPFVPLPEILMHLPSILHALLSMMESDNKMSIFAYNTLLWVISTLVDDKTERCMIFMQKLHTYVPKNTTIHEVLTKSMLYYLGMFDSKSHNKYVRATLKALSCLFKMVIASTQSSTSSLKSNNEQLKKDILEIFERLTDLIKLNDALLIATQVGCMQAFAETLPLVGGLLDDTSITKFICKYLSALPGFEAYRQAVSEKLSLFEAVVNCEYYLSQESNVVLMAVTLANILEPYIVSTKLQEVSEGINILNIFLDGVQSKSKFFNSIVTTFLPLIGKLSGAALKFSYDKTVFRSLSTILLSVLDGSFPQKVLTHLEKMSPAERQNTLDTLLTQLWKIISSDTYPPQWFTMWLFAFDVSIQTMTVLRPIILSSIETFEKEKELWHVVLKLCLALLNHKAIKFDRDISRKSLADEVLQERSDLEREVAGILNEMWEKINRQEAHFASVVVEPFVELLLLNHQPDIQDTAHRIFKSLLYHEFVTTQSIVKISGQTVDCFCSVSKKDGIPHDHFTGSIVPMLQQVFEGPSVDKRIRDTTAFQKVGVSLLRDLTELVQLLSQLEQIPDGIEWEDEKTIATFGLMEFFKRTNKQGPYISYIHQLVNQHESANRMAEAALSLMLHAELLNYSDEMLPELQQFPAQTSFERKRNLMMRAIDFFEKGKDWERAIDLLNQMGDLYKVRYDYQRVAEGLRMQAKLYENIITKERYLAEHFRVIFYGSGFPPTLRNREFIYRGFECERITAFISRMMSRFPRALQLPSNEAVPDSVINGDGQWLVIATVYPSSEDEMNRRRIEIDRKIPKFIRNYQRGRDLKVFTYSRPFRKSQTKSDNEFKDMWTMQYFLQVAQAFPSTQSRSEVIIRKEVELSPIETAIDAIRTKNSQVLDLVAFHKDPDNQGANINTLTLALNGVIDAEVNGGTKKYQEAFFSDAFKQQNPDRLQNIVELKEALLESIPILADGLTVHRNKCPENLQALQDKLETFYERMKTTIAATCT